MGMRIETKEFQGFDWVFQIGWSFVCRPRSAHPLTNTMIAGWRSLVFLPCERKSKPPAVRVVVDPVAFLVTK